MRVTHFIRATSFSQQLTHRGIEIEWVIRRWTNLALLILLGAAFGTGWLAFSFATSPARWSLVLHATAGVAIVLLTPWKSVIALRGLRRRRSGWWASLGFTVLVCVSIAAGLLHSTGLLRWAAGVTAMEVHVGAALAAIPFAAWHVLARRVPIRPTDLSRRSLLRSGTLLAGAGLAYAVTEGAVRLAALPGAGRRFTGSYELASLQPERMPITQWMFDSVPDIDAGRWRLRVHSGTQVREWTYEELSAFDDRMTAVLDCTGGFYSRQEWAGVRLDRLLLHPGNGLSVHVRSLTGYDRRFPIDELPRLLVATRVGGRPLDAGHGYPVRIVAPGRRAFWWIKWVRSIEVGAAPSWWQLPFPLQ